MSVLVALYLYAYFRIREAHGKDYVIILLFMLLSMSAVTSLAGRSEGSPTSPDGLRRTPHRRSPRLATYGEPP